MRAMLRALPGNRGNALDERSKRSAERRLARRKIDRRTGQHPVRDLVGREGPELLPRTTPLKPGTTDHGAIQSAQYGGNEGLWRIRARSIATRPPPRSSAAGAAASFIPR